MNDRVKFAVEYAKRGFKIVILHGIDNEGNCTCHKGENCKSSGKYPIYKNWEKKATIDENEILEEFKKHPNANIGFLTGEGYFVLDIDTKNNGYENLKSFGDLKKTVSVKTGSGGSHHYFKIPEGLDIPNKVGILPGVDIRSRGGLVVAPGSVHKNGNKYEWIEGCSIDETEIVEPDEWY